MTKQKVTLWLDSDIYQRTRDLLSAIPGKPSVSSVVDELLGGLTNTLEASRAMLGSGATPADSLALFASAFDEFVRISNEEDEQPKKPKK